MLDYVNVNERWVKGRGHRNTVRIPRRGAAIKKVEEFTPNGRVVRSRTRKLTKGEKEAILKGVFVPGLWKNCCLGRNRTRKSRA